jgi:hypothetical protein
MGANSTEEESVLDSIPEMRRALASALLENKRLRDRLPRVKTEEELKFRDRRYRRNTHYLRAKQPGWTTKTEEYLHKAEVHQGPSLVGLYYQESLVSS